MLKSLFKRSQNAAQWTEEARKRIERTSVQLFASVGTTCSARAFRVPHAGETLLLVELRSEMHWTSESLGAAKRLLLQGLNSELGFRLRDEDLIVGFAKPQVALAASPARAPRPVRVEAPASAVEVTEFGDSQWTAFLPTASDRDEEPGRGPR